MAEPPPRTLAEALERAAALGAGEPAAGPSWDWEGPDPFVAAPATAVGDVVDEPSVPDDGPEPPTTGAPRQRARMVLACSSIVLGLVLMGIGYSRSRATDDVDLVGETTATSEEVSTTARPTSSTGATSTSAATSTTVGATTTEPGVATTATTRRPTTTTRPTTPTTRRPTVPTDPPVTQPPTTAPPTTTAPTTTEATTTTTEATTTTTDPPPPEE